MSLHRVTRIPARRERSGELFVEALHEVIDHRKFWGVYGRAPEIVAYAPGRIEFIGNHTDYNGGAVLGAALDRGIWVAVAGRPGSRGGNWPATNARRWSCGRRNS